MLLKTHFHNWNIKNKVVFLRLDLNIESINETVKFQKTIPILRFLHAAGARTVIGTHRGRPHGYDAWLSTEQLLPLFTQAQLPIQFVEGVHDLPDAVTHLEPGSFLLLENLRFFQEPDDVIAVVQEICEFYINDSWGSAHREDPFVNQLAALFMPKKRSVGLLIEQEIHHLLPLKSASGEEFTALIGGAKYTEKLSAIQALSSRAGRILIGPAQSFPFHYDRNQNTDYFAKIGAGTQEIVLRAHHISQALQSPAQIILPIDYALNTNDQNRLSHVSIDQLKETDEIIGLGPQSTARYVKNIQTSQTVLYAGFMGFLDNEQSMHINQTIFDALAHVDGISIIAGGQTAQAAYDLGYENHYSWISTGGGATLAYICSKPMPGLELFSDN